ncbi:C-type lectin domain family 4 member G-like [Dendropsophus ebraccatus]|uniref:C-type lectin domain family 4 member G-like n=1 Tax=Dendropsophus ebraccatus TaxID=150705 RepID=UPI003831E6B7
MKNIQDHTRRKEKHSKRNVNSNGDELVTEMDDTLTTNDICTAEGVYMNVVKRKTEEKSFKKNKAPTTNEESPSNITKARIIVTALILLIILFLILTIITSILLKYYLAMSEEMSHLRNHENVLLKEGLSDVKNRTDDQQRMILEEVEMIKKEFDDVKLFIQNIKAINKTLVDMSGGTRNTCRPEWKQIRSDCYYFSTNLKTWEESKEFCVKHNGILIVIKDESEMTSLWPSISEGRYWIGLKRNPNNINTWVWIDGSPLTYSAWNKGEPNNDRNNEHCAEVIGDINLWNDLPCHLERKCICKGF